MVVLSKHVFVKYIQVFSWGFNGSGSLGIGSTIAELIPKNVTSLQNQVITKVSFSLCNQVWKTGIIILDSSFDFHYRHIVTVYINFIIKCFVAQTIWQGVSEWS